MISDEKHKLIGAMNVCVLSHLKIDDLMHSYNDTASRYK